MGYNNPMDKEETRNQHIDPEPAGSLGAQPAEQPQQPAYGMPEDAPSPAASSAPSGPAAGPAAPAAPEEAPPATDASPAAGPAVPAAPEEAPPATDASPAAGPAASAAPEEASPATDASPAAGPAASAAPEEAPLATDAPGEQDLALADIPEGLEDLEDLDELEDRLDDLDDRYIWDARRQRLYEKKPPKERKPRSLFQWLAIGGCGLLLLLSVAGWFRNGRLLLPVIQTQPEPGESQPVVQETAPQQDQAEEAPAVQGDTPEDFVPTSILVEGETIGTLASQEAAYSLLEDVKNYYGALAQEASPGELTVEVLEEVTFASPGPEAVTDGYESLYQQLTQGEGSPITVRCTVVSKAAETLQYETQEEKDKYLLEGTSIVEQMGREGASLTMTYTVYDNGRKRTSLSDTEEETIQPQDRLVRIGTQKADPEAEPDEDTGPKGPDTQLAFQAPADGKILRYFGQFQGSMHLGLDYGVGEDGQLTVLASCDGQVVSVLHRGGYGLVVEIDHGEGFLTRYAKLTSAQVELGDQVVAGQSIALVQQAEGQEEAYLHFELRAGGEAFNPCFYLD